MPKHFVNKKNIFCQFDRTKISKAKEIFKKDKLRILYNKNKLSREISILKEQNEIAHFDIVGNFQEITSMGIGIEEEYHRLQLSRVMMISMLTEIEKEEIDMNTFVYINGRPDHQKGQHDDLIMSLAMATYVGESSFTQISKNTNQAKVMMESWTVNTNDVQQTSYFNPIVGVDNKQHRNQPTKKDYENYLWLFKGL